MTWRSLTSPTFVVVVVILLIAAASMSTAVSTLKIHLRKRAIYPQTGQTLLSLPKETEHFRQVGVDQAFPAEVVDTLGTDNYISRLYVEKNPEEGREPLRVDFHAAYYTGTIDTVPHVPERCFVGHGTQISSAARVLRLPLNDDRWRLDTTPGLPEELFGRVYWTRLSTRFSSRPGANVRLPFDPQDLSMRVTGFFGEGGEFYAGYFFVANGGHRASAEGVRTLAFNLTDDYAYYLKLQFTIHGAGTPEEMAAASARFLDDMLGEVMLCVPDWAEVRMGLYPPDNSGRGGSSSGADRDTTRG